MQQAFVDVGHEMARFFAGAANGYVVFVENDADFVHEPDLLFVVAGEVGIVGCGLGLVGECCVDFWEEAENVLAGRWFRLGDGCRGRHLG